MLRAPGPIFDPDSNFWDKSLKPKMFKLYGHTAHSFLNETSWNTFIQAMKQIVSRGDVWATSWGEAFAYETVRSHTTISDIIKDNDCISFVISTSANITRYPIPITVRTEVPAEWNMITVRIDNKEISTPNITRTDGRQFVMFDVLPAGQQIQIIHGSPTDDSPPVISDIHLQHLANGTIIRFNVIDSGGFVTDVNATLITDNSTLSFPHLRSPIFWGNCTYGIAHFSDTIGSTLHLRVMDSNGNISEFVTRLQ